MMPGHALSHHRYHHLYSQEQRFCDGKTVQKLPIYDVSTFYLSTFALVLQLFVVVTTRWPLGRFAGLSTVE